MIKAVIKSIFLMLWLLLFIALLWLITKTRKKHWQQRFCNLGSSIFCFIIGLRVKVVGEVTDKRPLLVVCNHISYLDILVLGAKTSVVLTPKAEIEKWPLISTVCRLIHCVFIDRSVEKIKESREKIQDKLVQGEAVLLFPEGTTGNGRHLLPFKSSFFSIAENKITMPDGLESELYVQPAVISYSTIGALPIDSTQWPMVAWYGDMELAPHLFQLLKLSRIDAKLTLLPPVTISQFADRKELAAYCYTATVDVLQSR